ncbi:mannitol dehydrogenase family protein [Shumkonia mesophila]|uniref:mannitol dehydrogenase family protein n=1 Tax=Shumkonia mesophila TaxID=2838854 RepID=UPI002934FED4|nr:mannitol dehydrogenase family protein [Shumkonia mesophila]
MKRLNTDVLASLPAGVAVPAYDRKAVKVGIVHLGIGAFHRAHQAVFTDDVLAKGATEWGYCSVDLLGPDVRDRLVPQDTLYSVSALSGDGMKTRIIGSIAEIMVGPEDPEALLKRMCDPAVRIVSITVTEKGYCHDPASGNLNMAHPGIKADLQTPGRPTTIVGYLVEALRRRRAAGTAPFTVMSCDNLFSNGIIAKRVVTTFAAAIDADLGKWVEANVAFPCTMVDRITPSTTPDDIARVEAALGVHDAWPIVCEPFTQWVIEDNFPTGRPAWETAGAEMVKDVEPFEFMKLRLLNGSHSALSYLGALAGYQTIAECMADPAFVRFMRRLMDEDVTPTLHMPAGVDVGAYKDSLVERFVNPAIKHRTTQIAMDGSQKLPQRFCGTVRGRLAAGGSVKHLALAVAAWMRYVTGIDERGQAFTVSDPMAARLKAIGEKAGRNPEALVAGYLGVSEIFGKDLIAARPFVEAVTNWLSSLYAKGAAATVAEHYGK